MQASADASQFDKRLAGRWGWRSDFIDRDISVSAVHNVTIAADGTFSEYDSKVFLAFSNSLTRTLKSLGLEPAAAEKPPSLDQYFRHKGEAAD